MHVDLGHVQVCILLQEMALPERGLRLRPRSMHHFPSHPHLTQGFWPRLGKKQKVCQRAQIWRTKCNAPQRTPLLETLLQLRDTLGGKVNIVNSALSEVAYSQERFIPGTITCDRQNGTPQDLTGD